MSKNLQFVALYNCIVSLEEEVSRNWPLSSKFNEVYGTQSFS